MFEFLHPGFLAGAALVSSPIIIHLINRMRFKRVRWAAMEFLLKSQKRNRRRLIIEQLILLALRCLLVLLAVVLAARYLFAFDPLQSQGSLHVVLLDDTLSMSDHWPDKNGKNGQNDGFSVGKRAIVEDVARNAVQAGSAQRLALIYLSRPNAIVFNERLNPRSIEDLETVLNQAKCTPLHFDLAQGVENPEGSDQPNAVPGLLSGTITTPNDPSALSLPESLLPESFAPSTRQNLSKFLYRAAIVVIVILLLLALRVFGNVLRSTRWVYGQMSQRLSRPVAAVVVAGILIVLAGGGLALSKALALDQNDSHVSVHSRRTLHIVSDFRNRDWTEPNSARLAKALGSLAGSGVKVNLIDAANPARKDGSDEAMTDVPPYHDNLSIVDLRPESRVAARDMPVQFSVVVANFGISERKNVRVTFKVNGGQRLESETIANLGPGKHEEKRFLLTFDKPGFHQVSANLEKEETGLEDDNSRFAVLKVVERVPLLLIDGDPPSAREPLGDTLPVQTVFNRDVLRGYDVQRGVVKDLEKADLDQYPSIYLLNVKDLSAEALVNLDNYVRDGGNVAFFLGDKVDPLFYTNKLYSKGEGLFPAPLDRPVMPPDDPQERNKQREEKLNDGQPKIYLRDPKHQVFAEAYKLRGLFTGLLIEGYFPVPRVNWPPRPGPVAGQVEELASLPNTRSVRDYEGQAREVLRDLTTLEAKHGDVAARLKYHAENIEAALRDKPLFELARALEDLLQDAGEPDNVEQRPNLVEFWKQTELRDLRTRIDKFRETVQFGDPLVLARTYGKGRVVAFLTTAGQKWNNWSGSEPVLTTYPLVLGELQKYLTSVGEEAKLVGEPVKIERDGKRYAAQMRSRFFPETGREAGPAQLTPGDGPEADKNLEAPKEQFGVKAKEDKERERITYLFDEARKPGVYFFDLSHTAAKAGPDAKAKEERLALVYNVDTANESDLQRASKTRVEETPTGAPPGRVHLLPAGSERFKELAQRQTDLSETPWFYLLIMLVLIAEQAMAVRLSYHLRDNETPLPVSFGRTQPAGVSQ